MKTLLSLALLTGLLLACSDKTEKTNNLKTHVLVLPAGNVISVKDTSISVLSTSGPFTVGDVVGSDDGTFLRRIVAVAPADDQSIVLTTEDAELTEAVSGGKLEAIIDLSSDPTFTEAVSFEGENPDGGILVTESPDGSTDVVTSKIGVVTGLDGGEIPEAGVGTDPDGVVAVSKREIVIEPRLKPAVGNFPVGVDLSGTVLISQGAVSLVLKTGTVKFVPQLTYSLDVDKPSFAASMVGPATFVAEIELASTQSVSGTVTRNLWTSPPYTFRQMLGALPVAEQVVLAIDAEISISASNKASISGGYTGTGTASADVSFSSGTWTGSTEFPITVTPIPLTVKLNGATTLSLSLVPSVQVVFFPANKHLANARLDLVTKDTASLKATYNTTECPPTGKWTLSAGVSGSLAASLSVIDHRLGAYTMKIPETSSVVASGDLDKDECESGYELKCGKNGFSVCCSTSYPYFCDTGNEDTACWLRSGGSTCSTIMKCGEEWSKCTTAGDLPNCSSSGKLYCCSSSSYFFDLTFGPGPSCWTDSSLVYSTVINCGGDNDWHGCGTPGYAYDCTSNKCVKQ